MALQDYALVQSTLNAWKIVGALCLGVALIGGGVWITSPELPTSYQYDSYEEDDVLDRELF